MELACEADDAAVVGFVKGGGLGVQPQGDIATGGHAEGVALATAEHHAVVAVDTTVDAFMTEITQLLGLVGVLLVGHLLGLAVQMVVLQAHLVDAVDVVLGLLAVGGVGEAVLLLGLLRAVDLEEMVLLLAIGILDDALAGKDGIDVRVAVPLLDLTLVAAADPLEGVPAHALAQLGGDTGT